MSEKKFYVYVHRYASGPKEGQVFYVGKGSGKRSRESCGRNNLWHNIARKYGFTVSYQDKNITEADAFALEIEVIAHYRSIGQAAANLTDGGEGVSGMVPSEEARMKMSLAGKGRKQSPEHVAKRIESHYGKEVSEETRLKIGNSQRGEKHHLWGKQLPESTRTLISKAQKGRKKPKDIVEKVAKKKRKAVKTECGMIFDGMRKAAEWLRSNGHPKASATNISLCCRGKVKSAYGYVWIFA
jgi:hypothetical protein